MSNPLFEDFLASFRSPGTRRSYHYGIQWVLGDQPDNFIRLAKRSPKRAERQLVEFVRANRDRVASSTLANPIRAVKSFCDRKAKGNAIDWDEIEHELGKVNKVANDRGPDVKEIRKLLTMCDLKMTAVVLILASSGMRVGGFDYLRLGDVAFLENGLLKLTIYRGEVEEYNTFASTEAADAYRAYLESRAKMGEKLTSNSPAIRDKWSYDDLMRRKKRSKSKFKPLSMTTKSIQNQLGVLWVKSGVRKPNGDERHEFQQAHGFRKFFETAAAKAVQDKGVERLKGRKTNYYKPSYEELEAEYLKVLPYILINEKYTLKDQLSRQDQEHSARWADTKLKILELEENNRRLSEQVEGLLASGQVMTPDRLKEMVREVALEISGLPSGSHSDLSKMSPDQVVDTIRDRIQKRRS